MADGTTAASPSRMEARPGTAVLEALVHVGNLTQLVESHVLIGADLPGNLIAPTANLPDNWNAIPFIEDTQIYGDAWLAGKTSLALRVPSSVVPDDDILINPLHPDFKPHVKRKLDRAEEILCPTVMNDTKIAKTPPRLP